MLHALNVTEQTEIGTTRQGVRMLLRFGNKLRPITHWPIEHRDHCTPTLPIIECQKTGPSTLLA